MKALRGFKHRALCPDLRTLAAGQSGNPLKKTVPITASYEFTAEYLRSMRESVESWEATTNHPCDFFSFENHRFIQNCISSFLQDKITSGWLAWSHTIELYLNPPREKSSYSPWRNGDQETIDTLRAVVSDPSFWTKYIIHLREENGNYSVSYDNIAFINSICR